MKSVGFKEWAIVCEALGRGEQSIILRKGGIAEGREGFGFEHEQFFLFPTFFHEQLGKTRLGLTSLPRQRDGEIEINFFAKVEFTSVITSWETLVLLEPLHIWQRDVVRERFEYDAASRIHLAYVRVFRLTEPWVFPDAPRYGGCRSWVDLPQPPDDLQKLPVLPEEENSLRLHQLQGALTATATTR